MEFVLEADELVAELDRFADALDATTRAWAISVGELVASDARERAPKGPTSILANSIQALPPTGSLLSGDLEIVVHAGAPYALFVEEGTQPHEIRPRFRRALRWPVAGGFAFARHVRHPGTAPQPFLQPAVDANLGAIAAELEAAIELAFHRAGLG